MPYPVTTVTLQQWVDDIDSKVLTLRQITQQQNTLSAAGQLDMDGVRRYFDYLVAANVFLVSAAGVSGLAAYIQTQKSNVTPDAAADLAAIRTQIVATLDWLRTNVPSGDFGGTAYKLGYTFPANNTSPAAALVFTAPQTATYRTQLTALLATFA